MAWKIAISQAIAIFYKSIKIKLKRVILRILRSTCEGCNDIRWSGGRSREAEIDLVHFNSLWFSLIHWVGEKGEKEWGDGKIDKCKIL